MEKQNYMQNNKKKQPLQTIDVFGKLPPQAIELENAVLGAILVESSGIGRVDLSADDFYNIANKTIFQTALSLHNNHKPVDLLTVVQELHDTGKLEEVGGAAYIAELTDQVASAGHIEYHSAIIKQKAIARKLIEQSNNVISMAFSETEDVQDIIDYIEKTFTEIRTGNISSGYSDMPTAINETIRYLKELQKKRAKGESIGITTGLQSLDNQFNGGWNAPDLIILGGRPSMGKALKMDEQILTPTGWKLNKDLKVGDELASIDGRKSFITGVFPQGKLEMYEIEFLDGRKIECSGEHLWKIKSSRCTKNILTTIEIENLLKKERYKNRISIPMFCGEFGKNEDFTISPYLLGVLLGDGCGGVVWSKPDTFIGKKLENQGYCVSELTKDRFLIKGKKHGENEILSEYRKFGLDKCRSFEKFIPEIYLNSCRIQRKELLSGLLDTDGHCDKNGVVQYYTTSEKLSENVSYLSRSLGYRCGVFRKKSFLNGKRYRDVFVLTIVADEYDLFTLPRKHEREKQKRVRDLTIKSITKTDKREDCQCISVSHDSKLFITKDFIVTHNTQFALHFAQSAAKTGKNCLFVSIEMTLVQLMMRIFIEDDRLNFYNMKTGQLRDEDWRAIDDKIGQIHNQKMFIADDYNIRYLSNIKSLARKLHRENKLDLLIIDYLQLIKTGLTFGTRDIEVGYITGELKNLAKELNIPVILLAQLSRPQKGTKVQIPALSDLRESGNIEQDADKVIFPHRPTYYEPEAVDKKGRSWKNRGILIIGKDREGIKDEKIYFKTDDRFKKIMDDYDTVPRQNHYSEYEKADSQEPGDEMPF